MPMRLQVAVANMHRHGLVHGDLKPENVLLGDETASCAHFGHRPTEPCAPHAEGRLCADLASLVYTSLLVMTLALLPRPSVPRG